MTTTEAAQAIEQGDVATTPSHAATTASLARAIAELAELRRGDLAELRRMNPNAPDAAAFWRLMASHNLLDRGQALENKWALVIHGIALMTPTSSGEGGGTAHAGNMPVGRALFLGGEERRDQGFYSEQRLNRLLTAREAMLAVLLSRMFRMLASARVSFDWREMARLILSEGYDEEQAERCRRHIAREYYRAEHRAAQSGVANEDE